VIKLDYEQINEIKDLLNELPKEILIAEFVALISKAKNYDHQSVKYTIQEILNNWESINTK